MLTRMDAAGAVDAQTASTAPWKTAQNAVSHSAHTQNQLTSPAHKKPDTPQPTRSATQRSAMHTVSHIVREFFERYERSRNTMDAGLIDEQYPDAFMFAGPSGARIAEKATVMSTLAKGTSCSRHSATVRPRWGR